MPLLSKAQVDTILKNAPANADKSIILDGLIEKGYDLEGVDTELAKKGIEAKKTPPISAEPTLGQELKTDLNERIDKTDKILKRKDTGAIEKGVQLFGQGAGLAANATEKVIEKIPGVKAVGGAIASGINWLATSELSPIKHLGDIIGDNKTLQEITRLYDEDPNFKDTVDGVANIVRLGGDVQSVVDSAAFAKNVTNKVIGGVKTATKAAGEGIAPVIKPAVDATKKFVKGATEISKTAADNISRVPSRIATNAAEKQAQREVINTLPTKVAKDAVHDGVDVADVQYLQTIPKESKTEFQTLFDTVKDFEKGATKTNPIEVVGKPIVERIKQLESARGEIGQKLGAAADNLGDVTTAELQPAILEKLQDVSGLKGLKIAEDGSLDFTDTTLATSETASDRKAIQSIFKDAIKDGTGKQKHLLRQELFESLGGKKKSLTTLTATQEKAYEAIRKGLSDVLDTKNDSYKALNQEYAKVASPLQEIRKFMKNTAGANEDVLDMSAGLLARRLTSFSKSNPEIRQILRNMDEATAETGKAQVSVENLQDFYNVLDKYYDIAGKTGFQGQVKAGVERASGIKDAISKTVKAVAGKTEAVRRKALENAIQEILSN